MGETISGRGLVASLGVSEKAVRKAVEAGRIERAADGRYDLAACRAAWGRTTDPARSRVRTADHSSGPQSGGPQVRTALPPADAATLWGILADVVTTLPWSIVAEGGGLQMAFDAHADFVLNLTGILPCRQLAGPPVDLDRISWRDLAEEYAIPFIDPERMAADWQRRRDEP